MKGGKNWHGPRIAARIMPMRIYQLIRLLGAVAHSLLLFTFVYGRFAINATYQVILAVVTIIVVSVHALMVI